MSQPIAPPAHIPMEDVESSNIAAVGYDPDSQCLAVRFKSGQTWRYHTVPQSAYDGLCKAKSLGSCFHVSIRSFYPGEKVDG